MYCIAWYCILFYRVVLHSQGVFWFNPTETFIDVAATGHSVGKRTHWMSETGDLDFFLLPGPSPPQLYRQYTSLTGTQQLPPMFSLGYHQCRWNYRDEKDVADVHSHFEDLDFPVDVIWLVRRGGDVEVHA